MKKKYQVYQAIKGHLNSEGIVAKVSRHSRQVAIESANKLGLSPQAHAEIMQRIHEIHRDSPDVETLKKKSRT